MLQVVSKDGQLFRIFGSIGGKTGPMQIASGAGSVVETVFRYFRLVVERMSGNSGTIQFSKLQFVTADGVDTFKYAPAGSDIKLHVIGTASKGGVGSDGEIPTSGLLETDNKCCRTGIGTGYSSPYDVSPPLVIMYDLLSKRLDLSIFQKWHWYTSNDTASYPGRSMVKFRLDVSNTGENWADATDTVNWKTVDAADFTGSAPDEFYANKTLAYTGTIQGLKEKNR